MPKDTRTRYEGIYARHRVHCALESGGRSCSCEPSYWSPVWDRAAGRKRKTAFFQSIGEARNAREDLKAKLRTGVVPTSSTTRVSAAIEAYLAAIESGAAINKHGRRYKASAIRDLRGALDGHVKPALGARRLTDVRRADVQALIDTLTPNRSGSRVRTIVNAIRSLYAWAQDRELVDHDPAARVRLPAMNATRRDRVADVDELERLLAALKPEDALPYALAAYATARRAEIRHARVGDVDLKLGVIYLGADQAGRKSRAAQRAVPLTKPLKVRLRQELLRRGRPPASDLLCPGRKTGGRNSGMLSFEGLQKRVDDTWQPKDKDGNPVGAKVGERITAHECRHTCASWLDAADIRPVIVSQLMGHATPAHQTGAARITQERYTHALPGEMERARETFDHWLVRGSRSGRRSRRVANPHTSQ
jgi:integrase